MIKNRLARLVAAVGSFVLALNVGAALWVTGYYPQYEASTMPISKADLTAITHVIDFSITPEADGTLSVTNRGLTTSVCSNFVTFVHGQGKKALVCVGGAGSILGFRGSTTPSTLNTFVANIVSFVSTNHYDGVDIDWEPLFAQDLEQYTNFVNALSSGLNSLSPRGLLTVAAPAYAQYLDPPTAVFDAYATVQNQIDQINVMTYDLSGPYGGWVTWFNSPIDNGGFTFPSTPTEQAPSINDAITNYTSEGVAPGKLAIGIPFYGYLWGGTGITQPREAWPTTMTPSFNSMTYDGIVSSYYTPAQYHWDTVAQASYLSVTNASASNDMFISYEDTTSCTAKVNDALALNLGGIMIWELSQDYASGHPLVAAIQNALPSSGGPTPAPEILTVGRHGDDLYFTFSSVASGTYRVEYSADLSTWKTLTNNIAGTGSPVSITDTAGITSTTRFYRIKTPP